MSTSVLLSAGEFDQVNDIMKMMGMMVNMVMIVNMVMMMMAIMLLLGIPSRSFFRSTE